MARSSALALQRRDLLVERGVYPLAATSPDARIYLVVTSAGEMYQYPTTRPGLWPNEIEQAVREFLDLVDPIVPTRPPVSLHEAVSSPG